MEFPPRKNYCVPCKKKFSKTNNYTRHVRDKHSTDSLVKRYQCLEGECETKNRVFKFPRNLRAHLRKNHKFSDESIDDIMTKTPVVLVPNDHSGKKNDDMMSAAEQVNISPQNMTTQHHTQVAAQDAPTESQIVSGEEQSLSHNDSASNIITESIEIVPETPTHVSPLEQDSNLFQRMTTGSVYIESAVGNEKDVCLSYNDCDLNIEIDRHSVKSINDGILAFAWGGVRASHGVVSSRVFYEVKIADVSIIPNLSAIKELYQIRVGWSVSTSNLQLGENDLSFAFCSCGYKVHNNVFEKFGVPCTVGDVIGVYLDICDSRCVASFSINGIDHGTAFEFKHPVQALYPHILSKNVKYEVNFGRERFLPPEQYMGEYQLIGHSDCIEVPDTEKSPKVVVLVETLEEENREWTIEYLQRKSDKFHILSRRTLIEKMKVQNITNISLPMRLITDFSCRSAEYVLAVEDWPSCLIMVFKKLFCSFNKWP